MDGNGKPYHYIGHVNLSTRTLAKTQPRCGATAGSTAEIGVIGFVFYKENVREYAVMSGPEGVKPMGDMFVGIRDRQSPCSWTGTGIDPLENKYYGLFVEAYQTMKPLAGE
jgi:hypothetical protein